MRFEAPASFEGALLDGDRPLREDSKALAEPVSQQPLCTQPPPLSLPQPGYFC